jgi:hypothetical protein
MFGGNLFAPPSNSLTVTGGPSLQNSAGGGGVGRFRMSTMRPSSSSSSDSKSESELNAVDEVDE